MYHTNFQVQRASVIKDNNRKVHLYFVVDFSPEKSGLITGQQKGNLSEKLLKANEPKTGITPGVKHQMHPGCRRFMDWRKCLENI